MAIGMEDFKKESWRVHPVLDVPAPFPPAVMFSILDTDPRARYKDAFRKMSEAMSGKNPEPAPPMTPGLLRQGLVTAAWDLVFRDVPGDRMSILYRNPGKDEMPAAMIYATMIGSTGPAGTKWLVTRATRFGEKPVCWCKQFNVEKGESTDVRLTTEEMIDLESL
jgi:hypothetical protein